MLIKLKEAQKIDSSQIDEHGRLVSQTSFVTRDLLVNPEHVVSINEEYNRSGQQMSRVETTRGVFVVIGSPSEVQQQLNGTTATVTRSKKVLKD
jgi:hypothetical protein